MNILHEEGLITIRQTLDTRKEQTISTDTLIILAECILKNNKLDHDNSIFKEIRRTAMGNKMTPPYAIIFMGSLEKEILSNNF